MIESDTCIYRHHFSLRSRSLIQNTDFLSTHFEREVNENETHSILIHVLFTNIEVIYSGGVETLFLFI